MNATNVAQRVVTGVAAATDNTATFRTTFPIRENVTFVATLFRQEGPNTYIGTKRTADAIIGSNKLDIVGKELYGFDQLSAVTVEGPRQSIVDATRAWNSIVSKHARIDLPAGV